MCANWIFHSHHAHTVCICVCVARHGPKYIQMSSNGRLWQYELCGWVRFSLSLFWFLVYYYHSKMESIWCVCVCDVVIHVPPRTVRRRRANAKNRQFAHTEPAYKWHTAKLTFYLCVCGIVWLARTDKKSVGNAFWIRQNGICTAAVDKKYWTRIGNIHENRLRVFCMRFGYLNSHFLRSAFFFSLLLPHCTIAHPPRCDGSVEYVRSAKANSGRVRADLICIEDERPAYMSI